MYLTSYIDESHTLIPLLLFTPIRARCWLYLLFPLLSQGVCTIFCQGCTKRNKEVGIAILALHLPHHISSVQGKKHQAGYDEKHL